MSVITPFHKPQGFFKRLRDHVLAYDPAADTDGKLCQSYLRDSNIPLSKLVTGLKDVTE